MASGQQRRFLDNSPPETSPAPPPPSWTHPRAAADGPARRRATNPPPAAAASDADDSDALELAAPVHRSLTADGLTVSDLRRSLRERGTAIKFDDEVRLDNGRHQSVDSPLPKPEAGLITAAVEAEASASASPAPPQPQKHPQPPPPSFRPFAIAIRTRPRRHSEAEKSEYDRVTGAPLEMDWRHPQHFHRGEMRHPLLQSTIDDLAREELPSLTSDDTASSPPREDEDLTPSPITEDPRRLTASPVGYAPPVQSAGSGLLQTRRAVSQRSFGSLGSVGRRHTIKSAGSSLSSPARSFLAQWRPSGGALGGDAVREPDPDDEGQEIADTGYIIGRKIGFGGFSVVKEVSTIEDDRRVVRAVKIVRRQIRDKTDAENERFQLDFEREVDVWRCLKHRYVLPLILVYHTDFATYCITGLNEGGTLFDVIRAQRKRRRGSARRGVRPDLARRYAYQLGSAVRYLHEDVRVVHRDIKPENCLLDMSGPDAAREGGNVLLCDFGMAEFVNPEGGVRDDSGGGGGRGGGGGGGAGELGPGPPGAGNIGPSPTSTAIQGSLEYAAPELFAPAGPRRHGHHHQRAAAAPADVWAYGCVVYSLLTCEKPFQHEFQPRLALMISRGDWDAGLLDECWAVAEGGRAPVDVVGGCLAVEPGARMDIGEVLATEWLEGCKDALEESIFD
jgi:serine/threonine protein kinase